MHTIKKTLAILLTLAMLVAMPAMAVSAEGEELPIISEEVLHSITTEEDTGNGLAFRIQMNIKGAKVNALNEFVNTNATATVDGVEYKVVKMGAVMTNEPSSIADATNLTLDDVNVGRTIIDVPAKYLCAVPEAEYCEFAVRITKLPALAMGRAIACRPYVVLQDAEDNETVIYGDDADISTYNANYYSAIPEETPVLDVSNVGNLDDKITVSAAAEYAIYDPVNYIEGFKVTLSLENVSANAKPSAGDSVTYSFKDAEGNELGTEEVALDDLTVGESKDVEVYAPIGTTTVEVAETDLTYIPDIILPEIGSDIDVTKKKNRIRVSATSATFNEDGSIHVSLTFKNYTTNWITEETDYIKYAYYKGTSRKGIQTLYIGVIDTKKNPVKTFEFDVPSYTTKVAITSSKIVYWTEWA